MNIQKRKILGVDIGSSAVKLVGGNSRGRNWKFSQAQLPDGVVTGNNVNSAKLLASTVKKAMKAGRIGRGSAALSLSGHDVIIRHAILPQMPAEQLKQNVIDEITTYLSVDPELYNIDYKVQEVIKQGTTQQYKVMIVAVPKNIIASYIQALSSVGIKVTSVDVAPNTKEKLVNALVGVVHNFAVIDLGVNNTIIDTYQNNRFFISKVCQASLNDTASGLAAALETDQLQATEMLFSPEGDEASQNALNTYTDQIALETIRVLDYFRSRNNQQDAEHVYLCGGGTSIPNICEMFREKLDMPVTDLSEVLSTTMAKGKQNPAGLAVFAAAAGATLMEVDG